MSDIDEAIDAFRRGALEIDCWRMVLTQQKEGGDRFEGQGYIRQSDDGTLIFKIYVVTHNANPAAHLRAMFGAGAGKLYGEEAFYNLEATAHDGVRWTATRILAVLSFGATDMIVLAAGNMQSMTAHFDRRQPHHYLRLHFFEEYEIPCLRMSKIEDEGTTRYVLDRAEFEACGAKFEVQKREGSGDTIVELTSDAAFPLGFDLRIQEALQYLIAKPVFWRTRLQGHGKKLHLELSSPWRKTARTQFSPPISPGSVHFREHGWGLFAAYLSYVTQKTKGTHWNPVAYHLYNACETTANSVDARAVGVSVAVEAVAGLIPIPEDNDRAKEIASYQNAALDWLAKQENLSEGIVNQAEGQIKAMSDKRVKDTLFALAASGHVDRKYVKTWGDLRNRHVHPKISDLAKPTPVDMQKLFDRVHKVEVLLRQLTFHLIGYEGPFTDYGADNFPSKQYPLAVDNS